MKDKKLLQALKLQLTRYKTFECQLRHEKITNIDFDDTKSDLGAIVNRIGFCDRDFRNTVISCAHTMAAVNFKRLISDFLQSADEQDVIPSIIALDNLLCEIYLLDHEKGHLEKQYAFAKLNGDDKSVNIKLKIDKMVKLHSKYIVELESHRQSILTELELLIP